MEPEGREEVVDYEDGGEEAEQQKREHGGRNALRPGTLCFLQPKFCWGNRSSSRKQLR
jgi:hypothetical protein